MIYVNLNLRYCLHNSQKFERVLLPNPPFNAPFAFVYQAYPLSQIGESIFVMAVKKLNFKWRSLFYMYFFLFTNITFSRFYNLKKRLRMLFDHELFWYHWLGKICFSIITVKGKKYIKKKEWDDPTSSKPVVAHVWITRVRPFF